MSEAIIQLAQNNVIRLGNPHEIVPPPSLPAYVGLRWVLWPFDESLTKQTQPHDPLVPTKRSRDIQDTGFSNAELRWYAIHMHDDLGLKYVAPLPDAARNVFPLAGNAVLEGAIYGGHTTVTKEKLLPTDPFKQPTRTTDLANWDREQTLNDFYSSLLHGTVFRALSMMLSQLQPTPSAPQERTANFISCATSPLPKNGPPLISKLHFPPRTMLHAIHTPSPDVAMFISFSTGLRMVKSPKPGTKEQWIYYGLKKELVNLGEHMLSVCETKLDLILNRISEPFWMPRLNPDHKHAKLDMYDCEVDRNYPFGDAPSKDRRLEDAIMKAYPELETGTSQQPTNPRPEPYTPYARMPPPSVDELVYHQLWSQMVCWGALVGVITTWVGHTYLCVRRPSTGGLYVSRPLLNQCARGTPYVFDLDSVIRRDLLDPKTPLCPYPTDEEVIDNTAPADGEENSRVTELNKSVLKCMAGTALVALRAKAEMIGLTWPNIFEEYNAQQEKEEKERFEAESKAIVDAYHARQAAGKLARTNKDKGKGANNDGEGDAGKDHPDGDTHGDGDADPDERPAKRARRSPPSGDSCGSGSNGGSSSVTPTERARLPCPALDQLHVKFQSGVLWSSGWDVFVADSPNLSPRSTRSDGSSPSSSPPRPSQPVTDRQPRRAPSTPPPSFASRPTSSDYLRQPTPPPVSVLQSSLELETLQVIISDIIAHGSNSAVYLAGASVRSNGKKQKSQVAVKVSFTPDAEARLRHEYSIYQHIAVQSTTAQPLPFPHVYGLFTRRLNDEDVITALVMEHIEGKMLEEALNDGGISLLMRDKVQHALATLHEVGVVHDDLSLTNIMVVGAEVVILDFDHAKVTYLAEDRESDMRALLELTDWAGDAMVQ